MARRGGLGCGFGGLGWLVDGVTGRIRAWRGEVGRGDGGRVWGDAVRAVAPRWRVRGGRAEWRAVHPDLRLQNGRTKCTLTGNRRQVQHQPAAGEGLRAEADSRL